MRRRKKWQWRRLRFVLVALAAVWLVHEGRFYIPRWIRPPRGSTPMRVELKTTSYCHCGKCCSYHWLFFVPYQKTGPFSFRLKHVGKTSSGTMARPGTLAADPAVFPYGTVMHIPGYGYGRVEDTGGAIKGMHIDLYRPSHWYARLWGVRQKDVKVWLPPGVPPPADAGEAMPANDGTMDGNCVANGSTLN